MKTSLLLWSLRIIPAAIFFQTLFFKFSASEESVYIFSTLHIEPWGRIASGIAELLAAVLLLIPRTTWLGAIIGAGVMSGAIVSHLTILGIVVKNDGGLLFILALISFLCCAVLIVHYRKFILSKLPFNLSKFA